jgi:hypothetical protein
MGKTVTVRQRPQHGADIRVPRAEVRNIVQQAIDHAERSYPSDVLLLGKEGLLAAVDDNPTIDARAWLCQGSCGCPLTAGGRVTVAHTDSAIPLIFNAFFKRYDDLALDLARRYGLGRKGAIRFVFTD